MTARSEFCSTVVGAYAIVSEENRGKTERGKDRFSSPANYFFKFQGFTQSIKHHTLRMHRSMHSSNYTCLLTIIQRAVMLPWPTGESNANASHPATYARLNSVVKQTAFRINIGYSSRERRELFLPSPPSLPIEIETIGKRDIESD